MADRPRLCCAGWGTDLCQPQPSRWSESSVVYVAWGLQHELYPVWQSLLVRRRVLYFVLIELDSPASYLPRNQVLFVEPCAVLME